MGDKFRGSCANAHGTLAPPGGVICHVPFRRQIRAFKQFDRQGMDLTFRETAGTKATEPAFAPVIQKRFTQDAARRVTGAQKENVVSGRSVHFAQRLKG
jgi:hypothetical protein